MGQALDAGMADAREVMTLALGHMISESRKASVAPTQPQAANSSKAARSGSSVSSSSGSFASSRRLKEASLVQEAAIQPKASTGISHGT